MIIVSTVTDVDVNKNRVKVAVQVVKLTEKQIWGEIQCKPSIPQYGAKKTA